MIRCFVSKPERSTDRLGGKALNQPFPRHPEGTQRGQSRPSPEDRRHDAMTKITRLTLMDGGSIAVSL